MQIVVSLDADINLPLVAVQHLGLKIREVAFGEPLKIQTYTCLSAFGSC